MNATVNTLLTCEEARAILRIGRNAIYTLVKEEKTFPSIRILNQIRIPHKALIQWIEQSTNK